MAIWQEEIIVIPREVDLDQDHLDLRTTENYHRVWLRKKVASAPIIQRIDAFISRARWVNSKDWYYWKGDEKNFEDNDISLTIDEDSGIIKFLSFRFDTRSKTPTFLLFMIELCKEMNCLFQSYGGGIFEPELEHFHQVMDQASFKAFLQDPEQYVKS